MKQRGQEYFVLNQPCIVAPEHYDFFFSMQKEYQKPQQIEVTFILKKKVDAATLQKAADTSLCVFPTFRECLYVKEEVLYTYFSDRVPPVFCDESTQDRGVLCSTKVNPYRFRISYENQFIRVRVDHALTDGHGVLRYAKTLLYYYLLYSGEAVVPDPSVTLLESPINENEFADVLQLHDETCRQHREEIAQMATEKSLIPFIRIAEEKESFCRSEIHFPTEQLLKLSKETESSPISVLFPFYAQAIMQLTGNPENLPVACNSPFDMRGVYHKNTMRNASRSASLKYYPSMVNRDLALQGTIIRGQIDMALNYPERIQADRDPATLMASLSRIPIIDKKTAIFPFLSALGKFQMSQSMMDCVDDIKFDADISILSSYTGFISFKDDMCIFCNHKYGGDEILRTLMKILEENHFTPQYKDCGTRQFSRVLFC